MGRALSRAAAVALVLSLAIAGLAACSDDGGSEATGTTPTSPPASEPPSTTTADPDPDGAACPEPGPPVTPEGPSVAAESFETAAGVPVDLARYPRPDTPGDPWSQWGEGIALDDGRFLSAMGDHGGADADSYLFVYDPATGRLTRFADLLSATDHAAGDWGFGKVHAPMVAGPCGEVYLATYWGENPAGRDGYDGDELFRLDPQTLALEPLGVPIPGHGLPSMAGVTADGLLYGEAHDPARTLPDRGTFFAYDVERGEVVFRSDDDRHGGFRDILVDASGAAYVAGAGGGLLRWEPGSDALVPAADLPGEQGLRASTAPGPDGTVYGVTNREANDLFALHADGSVDSLGSAGGYTASMAIDPEGTTVYWVPGAHGAAWEQGTPLMALDTATGEQRVVAELNDVAERELGLTLGGTYSVAVDPSGARVYIGFNAGPERDDAFGETVLAVVHLDGS